MQFTNALEAILSPITLAQFFGEYYEVQPLHIGSREVQQVYKGLPGIEGFENLLWSQEEKLNRVLRVNRQGSYLQPPPRSSGKDVFRWSIDQFGNGYTLILNGMDTMCPAIARLVRDIEVATGGKVAANGFLTPPNNHGFNPHFDTHDVFILQLEGTKTWKLFDHRIVLPVDHQIYLIDQSSIGEPSLEVTLQPGDLLYVPRGVVHGAYTAEQASLHLTAGYRPLRWVDYFHSLVDEFASENVDVRRSVGSRFSPPTFDHLSARLADFQEMCESARFRRLAFERFSEAFLGQLRPLPGAHIANRLEAGSIKNETKVVRRQSSPVNVFEKGGRARIQFPGVGLASERDLHAGALDAPLSALAAFKFIASMVEPFRATDIPSPLDDESKLTIVRRLVQEGLLQIFLEP